MEVISWQQRLETEQHTIIYSDDISPLLPLHYLAGNHGYGS